jgi:hypothetical protein
MGVKVFGGLVIFLQKKSLCLHNLQVLYNCCIQYIENIDIKLFPFPIKAHPAFQHIEFYQEKCLRCIAPHCMRYHLW